jgi:hypothetical protein
MAVGMGVWIELHCDGRSSPACQTQNGNSPGGMAHASYTVSAVLTRLNKQAREDGWVRQRGVGLLCPACAAGTEETARDARFV